MKDKSSDFPLTGCSSSPVPTGTHKPSKSTSLSTLSRCFNNGNNGKSVFCLLIGCLFSSSFSAWLALVVVVVEAATVVDGMPTGALSLTLVAGTGMTLPPKMSESNSAFTSRYLKIGRRRRDETTAHSLDGRGDLTILRGKVVAGMVVAYAVGCAALVVGDGDGGMQLVLAGEGSPAAISLLFLMVSA